MSKKAIIVRKGSWHDAADFIAGNQPKPKKPSQLVERLDKLETLLKDKK